MPTVPTGTLFTTPPISAFIQNMTRATYRTSNKRHPSSYTRTRSTRATMHWSLKTWLNGTSSHTATDALPLCREITSSTTTIPPVSECTITTHPVRILFYPIPVTVGGRILFWRDACGFVCGSEVPSHKMVRLASSKDQNVSVGPPIEPLHFDQVQGQTSRSSTRKF